MDEARRGGGNVSKREDSDTNVHTPLLAVHETVLEATIGEGLYMVKASKLFVESLEASGVKYVFGVPGEENLAFVEALRGSSIALVTMRDEQSAVFMAATVGRLSGRVGVALSTLGPGATNLVT